MGNRRKRTKTVTEKWKPHITLKPKPLTWWEQEWTQDDLDYYYNKYYIGKGQEEILSEVCKAIGAQP